MVALQGEEGVLNFVAIVLFIALYIASKLLCGLASSYFPAGSSLMIVILQEEEEDGKKMFCAFGEDSRQVL